MGIAINPDPTMIITQDELRWSLELKLAVMGSEELDNLSDMEYAQHAIIAGGKVEEGLRRIERMQVFRQYYQVDNSIEQGLKYIRALIEQQPGFLLNIDIDLARNEAINVFDCGCFDPNVALSCSASPETGYQDNWKVFACAVYYIKYISQPTLAVVRHGLLELGDFGGYGWSNFSVEVNQKLMDEVISWLPTKWNGLLMYNTGSAANVIMGLCKPLMSESMRNSLHLGCQVIESDGSRNNHRRLSEFYMQPTPEEAQKSLLERAEVLITTRRHNEDTFRLR